MSNSLEMKAKLIRDALLRGEPAEAIVLRFNTSLQAVKVVQKGLSSLSTCTLPPWMRPRAQRATGPMWPWPGHHVSMDGTNVAGWSRRLGEPRLVQPLAIARYFGTQRVRFSCWFDSNFRHCLWKYNPKDAAVFDTIVRMEPAIFKQAPAGVDANGKSIKADPFVLRDAEPDGLVLAGDLYRREARENPTLFGWTQNNPQRRITGQIASNGDILLGPCGEVRIPVVDDAEYYLH